MPIQPEALEVLNSNVLAHVVTLKPDGRPHASLAWVGVEDDEIVFGTLHDQHKLENVRRDPRVTLSLQTDKMNPIGLTEYLVVYGSGRVTEGGAPELLQELAYTYIGPGVKFPPMPDPPPGFVTRVAVERLGGVGPWASSWG
ncbi:MAG TPA: TIGR03618 family F420-dependent PPOX class oxidoreductase [Actinomycetota bacterium]|nr:TIGR03618 family F420-dependent PPOX class oxidoreductase [Actinomycetota bacterium]